jgi:hypothetical protein
MSKALAYAFLRYSRVIVLNHRLNYKYIWRITPPSAATLQTKTENLDRQLRWFRSLKIATSSINLSRRAPYLLYIKRNATNDQAVTESGHVWWPKTWCHLMIRTNHQCRLQWKWSEVPSKGLMKTIKTSWWPGSNTLYISSLNIWCQQHRQEFFFCKGDAHYQHWRGYTDYLKRNAGQDSNISCHWIKLLN